MSIYMKTNNFKGDVTAKGYEGSAELEWFSLGYSRQVSTHVGNVYNRQTGVATINQLSACKLLDSSSAHLCTYLLTGDIIPQVEIFLCSAEKIKGEEHVVYTFENVMVTKIRDIVDGDGKLAIETFELDFTKFYKCHIPRDAANKIKTRDAIGFDLGKATIV